MVAKRAKPPKTYAPLPIGSRVIGLDVSTTAAGIAVMDVEPHGLKVVSLELHKPLAKLDWQERAYEIQGDCFNVIEDVRLDFDRESRFACIEIADGATWSTKAASARTHEITKTAIAQGMVLAHLIKYFNHYDMITSTKWSRGRKKEDRAKAIALQYPAYAKIKDPGYDVADAIGLCLWRWEQGLRTQVVKKGRVR